MAMEFGPLLRDVGGSGVGFSWSGIVSQRWEWGTVHFNVETNLTQDQHGELFFDAIVEGPNTWKVRPVFEIYSDSVISVSQSYSALAGAIWQVNDKLSLDVAFRYALVDGRPVEELRAGMTFGFPLVTAHPANTEMPDMVGQGRR
jgi:opacity protein-like surface antigen